MYQHEYQLRVRYADTDQMGYVYYGKYPAFYEIGRVEALRALGMSYKALEAQGIMMPVIDLKARYLKPAYYDELLTLTTKIIKMPSVRIFFEYEIFNENRELLHASATTLVFVNRENMRPCRAPEQMIAVLSPFFAKN